MRLPGLFSSLIDELRRVVLQNNAELESLVKRSPNAAYKRMIELAGVVGSIHRVDLQVHFPAPARIYDTAEYGTENVSLVVDKFRKRFPIPREEIRAKVSEIYGPSVKTLDAYMYEGKEGLRAVLPEGGRVEILPGSMHFWCTIKDKELALGDWLMNMVYMPESKA